MLLFHSNKEGFYNETMKELVAKKASKLDKFNKDTDYVFRHKIRKTGEHKIELHLGDLKTHAEHKSFETALIEVVADMERVLRKAKETRLKSKRHAKTHEDEEIVLDEE